MVVHTVKAFGEHDSIVNAAANVGSHQIRRRVGTDTSGALVSILSLSDVALEYGVKVVDKTLEEISES